MKKKVFNKMIIALKDNKTTQDGEVVNVVAVVGDWKGYDSFGGFSLTQSDLLKIVENFNKTKSDIVVDYEHQTLDNIEAPAAGWIKSLSIDGVNLLASIVWTERAKKYIENDEYKYLSPVLEFSSTDSKSGQPSGVRLHSVALTNAPFIDELGEVKINKNTKEDDAEDIVKLKDELATARVDNAILSGQLESIQRDWAIAYCKKDFDGFEKFLTVAKATKVTIENNLFLSKDKKKHDEAIDIVSIALKLKK